MIVAITGTPGTGKTSVSEELSKLTGWKAVSLNSVAEDKGLYAGHDRKRKCKIVDMDAIEREMDGIDASGGAFIIESHYSHDIPSDVTIILRTNPGELRKRGEEKGWNKSKAEENIEAEIMEVCASEAKESANSVIESDTTGRTPAQSAAEIARKLESMGFFVSRELRLPENMRETLRKPYGKLFKDLDEALVYMKGSTMHSVGDEVGYDLYSRKITPEIMATDGMIRRKPSENRIETPYRIIRADNRAGYITKGLWKAVQDAISSEKPVRLDVNGEEDMAVLPLMLLGREGDCIAYGLFDKGVCVVRIGNDSRETARKILSKIASSQ